MAKNHFQTMLEQRMIVDYTNFTPDTYNIFAF